MRSIVGKHRLVSAGVVAFVTVAALSRCAISRADDIQMGQDYAAELNKQLVFIQDPELNRYLTTLGDSIARPADTQGLAWHFYLVDSKEVNAFALPAGHVYVTRALVERTTTLDQLAGAMGHTDTQRVIASLDPGLVSRLVVDRPNFQRFRSRLLTLYTHARRASEPTR